MNSKLDELAGQSDRDSTPDTVDGLALARLYGEPLFNVPTDLYIPPDALEVFLEAFEGPLDLLLYLIRKQNFNILDIPMADLTRQYLEYINEIRNRNLELAAEYLLMAAMLIEIKSRMLLPVIPKEDGSEPEDPRAELARRLIEYEQMKLAAQELDKLPVIDRDFWVSHAHHDPETVARLPDVLPHELKEAWQAILRRASLNKTHTISREELSVREHMTFILRRLQTQKFVEFFDLFDVQRGVPVVVVHFIAMLELTREGLLRVTQAEPYAPIYVRLGYEATGENAASGAIAAA
ncbi:ScpA family protein [Limnobacter sp.]|uniref:segregation and condensation protein A n=1 Tax=Limnobacter sp. TaxID=2003368 RepID=UPI0025904631|nr:ScpA family protein [Limnobacter sp.]